ncbi:MAG: EamA family transporter [Bacilli bacterium]
MKLRNGKNKMIFLFLIYVCLSAGGLILFKLGSKDVALNITSQFFSMKFSWLMLLGILCYAGSFVLWLVIVSSLKLSYAMPMSVGLVNLLVLIGSILVLNEKVGMLQWIGTVVIIIGLFIINIGG